MEVKNNLEILNEIRNKRNEELKMQGRTDISVIRVEYLCEDEEGKRKIFREIERQEFYNKPSVNVEKFYSYENGELTLVAGRSEMSNYEILPIIDLNNENDDWDILKEEIEKGIDNREKKLQEIAMQLGISEKEITALSEIELEQQVIEKQDGKDEIKENEKEQEEQKEDEKNENEPEKLTQKQVDNIGLKNQVSLNAKVDSKGKTLGQELGLDEYTSIGIVHAYKLTELTNSEGKSESREDIKFGLVGQKKDGTYEKIPESKIRMYRGGNTEITAVKNPQEVEHINSDCMFEVVGSEKRLSINQSDPYGIPDVYLAKSSRDNDGNIAQKLQDQYDGTEKTDVEVRALFNENRGTDNIKNMKDEAKKHEEAGCDELDIDEIDGNVNTGHKHFDLSEQEQQNAIEEIMEKGKVSREEAENKFAKELEENEDITIEEAKENVMERIEEEYRGLNSRENH